MEMYAEVKVRFASDELCKQAIQFLNDEGPEDIGDVEETYRCMYDALQESMPIPRSEEVLGNGWLRVSFDILGDDAADGGHNFIHLWQQAGVVRGYVLLSEDYDELWLIDGSKLECVLQSEIVPSWYQGDQWDEIVAKHDGDELEALVVMHERAQQPPPNQQPHLR